MVLSTMCFCRWSVFWRCLWCALCTWFVQMFCFFLSVAFNNPLQSIHWNAVLLPKSVGQTVKNTYPLVGWLITMNYSRLEDLNCAKVGLQAEGIAWEKISLSYSQTPKCSPVRKAFIADVANPKDNPYGHAHHLDGYILQVSDVANLIVARVAPTLTSLSLFHILVQFPGWKILSLYLVRRCSLGTPFERHKQSRQEVKPVDVHIAGPGEDYQRYDRGNL